MLYKKYAPSSVQDAIGMQSAYASIKKWIAGWQKGKKNNFLIVHGASGCGKSMLIDLVAKELMLEKIDFYDTAGSSECLEMCRQHSLICRGKIIVIDEPKSVRGITEMINESHFPVVILTENLYKPQLQNLRMRGTKVEIRRTRYDSIARLLADVCEKEGLECSEQMIMEIAKQCKGDIRAAFLDMESFAKNQTAIETRDVNENVFNTMKIIFHSFDSELIKNTVRTCDKPLNELFWWIENNIFRAYSGKEEIAEAYEYLAQADLFNSRIMKRQNYALMKYLMSLAVMGVAFSKNSQQYGYKGFVRYMPPTVRTRRKHMDGVLNKIAVALHTTTRKAETYMPLIRKMAKTSAETLAEFNLDRTELKLLGN